MLLSDIKIILTTVAANMDVVEICGLLAPLASIVVFLAPIPTMAKIKRDRTVGSLPLLPYSSMAASCSLWTTYGILKNEPKIYASNAVGLCLALYYVSTFLPLAPTKHNYSVPSPTLPGSIRQHLQGCAAVAGFTVLAALLLPAHRSVPVVGNLGIVFCLILFASPLAALKTVLDTRSAASIPLPFTVATTANCTFWTVWGWYQANDYAIYFPNGLGLSFGLVQLGLKLKFGNGPAAMASGAAGTGAAAAAAAAAAGDDDGNLHEKLLPA